MMLCPTYCCQKQQTSVYIVAKDRHKNDTLSLCIQMSDCGEIINKSLCLVMKNDNEKRNVPWMRAKTPNHDVSQGV